MIGMIADQLSASVTIHPNGIEFAPTHSENRVRID